MNIETRDKMIKNHPLSSISNSDLVGGEGTGVDEQRQQELEAGEDVRAEPAVAAGA